MRSSCCDGRRGRRPTQVERGQTCAPRLRWWGADSDNEDDEKVEDEAGDGLFAVEHSGDNIARSRAVVLVAERVSGRPRRRWRAALVRGPPGLPPRLLLFPPSPRPPPPSLQKTCLRVLSLQHRQGPDPSGRAFERERGNRAAPNPSAERAPRALSACDGARRSAAAAARPAPPPSPRPAPRGPSACSSSRAGARASAPPGAADFRPRLPPRPLLPPP